MLFDQLTSLLNGGIDDVTAALENWTGSVGAAQYLHLRPYGDPRTGAPVLVTNFSLGWQKNYIDAREHRFDPVVQEALGTVALSRWSDAELPQDPVAARVMRQRYQHGCRAGVAFPVHGPAGQFSILSFWSADADALDAGLKQHGCALLALANGVHRSVYAGQDQAHPLSPIEVECLRWTAQGKTAWEISVLMSLPERTVHYHIGEASRKLGAPNKTAASCIALKARIIE